MKFLHLFILVFTASFSIVHAQSNEDADEEDLDVFELSPFTIQEEDGYKADTTLAGSRVKSNLRDLGASSQHVFSLDRF